MVFAILKGNSDLVDLHSTIVTEMTSLYKTLFTDIHIATVYYNNVVFGEMSLSIPIVKVKLTWDM